MLSSHTTSSLNPTLINFHIHIYIYTYIQIIHIYIYIWHIHSHVWWFTLTLSHSSFTHSIPPDPLLSSVYNTLTHLPCHSLYTSLPPIKTVNQLFPHSLLLFSSIIISLSSISTPIHSIISVHLNHLFYSYHILHHPLTLSHPHLFPYSSPTPPFPYIHLWPTHIITHHLSSDSLHQHLWLSGTSSFLFVLSCKPYGWVVHLVINITLSLYHILYTHYHILYTH